MYLIDCESEASALNSMSLAFSCSPVVLSQFLANPEIINFYISDPYFPLSFKEYVYEVMVKHFGEPDELKGVYWFHTTRTNLENTFESGIKPLNLIIEELWSVLISVTDDQIVKRRLIEMRQTGVFNNLYQLKTQNSMHWGPYAIQVRDIAFFAEEYGQHNYLGMPEIIEDICIAYQEKFGSSLFDILEIKLVPKIVKFYSEKNVSQSCVETALAYLVSSVQTGKPGCGAVYCFDSYGEVVASDAITSVTNVEYRLPISISPAK